MGVKLGGIGALLGLTLALGLPVGAMAEEADQAAADKVEQVPARPAPTDQSKAWDALAVRPVSFASSVFSTGVFVLTIPFAAMDPAIDMEKSRENLVQYPFRDSFQRPLGDFSGDLAGPPGGSAWSLPASQTSAAPRMGVEETAPGRGMAQGAPAGEDTPAGAATRPYTGPTAASGAKKDSP